MVETRDRIFTVPNALSLARLLGVPLFFWLVLAENDGWAIGLLVLAGLSDWADGKLARALNQTSRLGTLLDPAADRLYILATLVGLTVRGIIPWWLVAGLAAREVYMGLVLVVVKRHGWTGLPVHLVGKAATMCLLYSFPLLLWGDHDGAAATAARVVGWAWALWGTALYWWAAVLYTQQARQLIRALPPRAGAENEGVAPAP
ncbi:CDP-diacylglycerol-phosphatidylglycerol phosphatidyltransferase [Actinocorallia herbida]|uniref:CDP-diacylglycerol-phosphatidylglycerol phosphatidyltransferase n=1 Tax=Actinocorallia herbida TaxID=58109 RepID=A0A3N1CTI8_9ACTN|nr:CDP-diacylglycerol-phosphatidylglycerol phosphatidyltransferase [Actinocorallia herbida]